MKLNEVYVLLIEAILDKIRAEMDRLYWNKYQHDMRSPFDNTAEDYVNSTFEVHAYYWGEDEELINRPNFRYKGLRVYWYKYCGRGMEALLDKEDITVNFLAEMLDDCINSMREDFGERE